MERSKFSLGVLCPGHFHAALSLRESHPFLEPDVYVYAEEGPELEAFKKMAQSFNDRSEKPTAWNFHFYTGTDPAGELLRQGKTDIVILAGKNNVKLELLEKMVQGGLHVFSDKPLVPDSSVLPLLESAFSPDKPFSLDIMTERYEITTLLQKAFLGQKKVFGEIRVAGDGSPSIFKESIHHLYKIVNGQPLQRPPWYFDVNIQGEGIIDVMTHLVDMTHWMLFPRQSLSYGRDFSLKAARRWPTLVTTEKFQAITHASQFPPGAAPYVGPEGLEYFCNGEIQYHLKNIPIHTRVLWNVEPPPGGGDTHFSRVCGTVSDLLVKQLPENGFKPEFSLQPHSPGLKFAKHLDTALEEISRKYSGLSWVKEGKEYRIEIPARLRTTHEEHFCEARDAFLELLMQAKDRPEVRQNITAKYTLLARAKELALQSPYKPLPGNRQP